MMFEHFAINVEKPKQMAEWYVRNLNMEIAKAMEQSPYTHFLADYTGRLVMEIYTNEKAEIPDYQKEHPLRFHMAFASGNAEHMKNELVKAGATVFEELKPKEGTHLVMLRDPFGVPLQICQRSENYFY
jgi:catechol 2,3-dioxygenase-like lactoylglutathione lyase family enzyme